MCEEFDARKLVTESLEKLAADDSGAPFERPVLQALLHVQQEDTAEFHRLQSELTRAGVSTRDLNAALKREQARQKQEQASCSGEPFFSPDRVRELEERGFVVDPQKGIVDIKSNRFAKHVLQNNRIVLADGERFFFYKDDGVWRPFRDKQLQRRLYRLIERLQPDVWQSGWESRYMTALARAAEEAPEFDKEKNLINLANGMFDTDSMELLDHDPSHFSSIQNPIEYNEDAECPRFLKFLDDVFEGDKQTVDVVQEALGYCCTAETRAHKVFILEGVGSNGKSVLIEIIEHLCGKQNVSHVAMNELNQPFARAELVGKLLNVSSENEFSEKGLNTQQIKSIAAGDMIRVENKHEKGFSYRPVCKLLFGMNTLPATMDKSHGFFRRLVIIPFRRVFRGSEADKMLLEKLLKELPGIFNFAMEGLRRLRERDFIFSESKAIEQAVNSYKSEQNPVIPFVSDFVQAGSVDERVAKNELFDRFQTWCRQQGEKDFALKSDRDRRIFWTAFRNALLEAGISMPEERKSSGVRFYHGLTLLKEAKPNMADIFDDSDDEAATETTPDKTRSRTVPSEQKPPLRVPVGGKFEELHEDDADELLFPDEGDDNEADALADEQLEDDAVACEVEFLVNGFQRGLSFEEWQNKGLDLSDKRSFGFQREAVEGNHLFQERVTVA